MTKKVILKCYLEAAELEALKETAARLSLSVSALVRRLALGLPPPAEGRPAALRALSKTNADLARLGNLLKMAMDDADFPQPRNPDLEPERLLVRIDQTRTLLKTRIKEL